MTAIKMVLILLIASGVEASPTLCKVSFLHPTTATSKQNLTLSVIRDSLQSVLSNPKDVDKFRDHTLESSQIPQPLSPRPSSGFYLELQSKEGSASKTISIYVDPAVESPEILVSPNKRRLVLPLAVDPAILPSEIRKLLIGHPLHPHNSGALASTSNYRKLKEVQGVALQALQKFLVSNNAQHFDDANKRKILFVGPGGVGKTSIYLQALEWQLQQSAPGLHMLVADTTGHLNQMHGAVQRLLAANPKIPVQLIKWGGNAQATTAHVLGEQTKIMQLRGASTVLVTTIQSLRQKVVTENEAQELLPLLSSIIYDEAHHAGAKMAKNLITQLIDGQDSKAFFIGTTATPIHRQSEISALFGGNIHWFYFDKTRGDEMQLSSLIDQLARAIESGDITPFYRFHFLNRKNLSVAPEDQLFVADSENRIRVLNPKLYSQVFRKIGSLFERQKKIVIMAGTIASADRILEFLTQHYPEIPAQSLHSDSKDSDLIFDDFKSGKYRLLVTVKKFDEALDDPEIDTVIDLSASASPRQLVQRLARPARLAVGKEEVTAVLFLEANEDFIREQIMLIQALLQKRLQGNTRHLDQMTNGSNVELGQLKSQKKSDSSDSLEGRGFDDESLIRASYLEMQATLVDFWNQHQQTLNLTAPNRMAELIKFIDTRISEKSKRLLPSKSAEDPEERKLEAWLGFRKNRTPENWYEGLPQYQIEALKELGLLKVRIKQSIDESLPQLSAFIAKQMERKDIKLLPSNASEDPKERYLGSTLRNRKRQLRADWYLGLPENQIEALRERGLLEIKQAGSNEDTLAELTAFIDQRLTQGKHPLLPSRSSKNEAEKSLAMSLINLKQRLGQAWYEGLPQHQIEVLKEGGHLEIRKSSKPKSPQDRLADLITFIDEKLNQQAKNLLPRLDSETQSERTLAVAVKNRKTKFRNNWYVGLPQYQIDALKERDLLEIRKRPPRLSGKN